MTSFYYYDQNPSVFCFLVLISAFVIQTSLGLTKVKYERKNEKDSGRSSKMTRSRCLVSETRLDKRDTLTKREP